MVASQQYNLTSLKAIWLNKCSYWIEGPDNVWGHGLDTVGLGNNISPHIVMSAERFFF